MKKEAGTKSFKSELKISILLFKRVYRREISTKTVGSKISASYEFLRMFYKVQFFQIQADSGLWKLRGKESKKWCESCAHR